MLQITLYHLLIQLHIPEMLGHTAFKQYDQSPAHCQGGIDVKALLASTALAITYIITHQHSSEANSPGPTPPLFHHHLPRPHLLESTLTITLRTTRMTQYQKKSQVPYNHSSPLKKHHGTSEHSYITSRHSTPDNESEAFRYCSSSSSSSSRLKIDLPNLGIVCIVCIVCITKQNKQEEDLENMLR